jgi:hypothetical protein
MTMTAESHATRRCARTPLTMHITVISYAGALEEIGHDQIFLAMCVNSQKNRDSVYKSPIAEKGYCCNGRSRGTP